MSLATSTACVKPSKQTSAFHLNDKHLMLNWFCSNRMFAIRVGLALKTALSQDSQNLLDWERSLQAHSLLYESMLMSSELHRPTLIRFILRIALTQKIIAHNSVSSSVFNMCTVGYSIVNHVSSFQHVFWQNFAVGNPGKIEINIFYAYLFKFQNH